MEKLDAAHHYFEVDAEEIFNIIQNDLEPLKKAIDFLRIRSFVKITNNITFRENRNIVCY